VKSGGADPVTNAKLDTLIKQAKDLGVPRDIIDRNIKRASDTKQVRFWGFNLNLQAAPV
jgi:transcriptional/translational regulatory protein YebC/TACO1